jgi:hypothetical protein
MRTHVLAFLAALLLLLGVGVGTAAASDPTQAVGQDASSQQSASSNANATQVAPSNENVDVRIFSPGNSGDVKQTNAAGALAIAGNANTTDQSASQDQSGAGTQAVGQEASNDQSADASADATQIKPSNENISVRIKSPGNDGKVDQTNAALAGAKAGNANSTTQAADQSQSGDGCKCGGGGTQAVGQSADSKQSADADADATQIKPTNSNISVRIGSAGNGGDVTQTNAALAGAKAGNVNEASQSADQSQRGDSCKCGHGGGVQAVGQEAGNEQSATSEANAVQFAPSNENTSVRIHSAGNDGDVTQTNAAAAVGLAFNANKTDQSVTQSQGGGYDCKCGGTPVQAVGQFAYNDQDADAEANAYQIKPSNSNTPVRIGSPGNGGSVTQTNAALAAAVAGNLNLTSQSTTQSQAGGGGVQAVGQEAGSEQDATADATAFQLKPTNSNAPVSIGGGHDKKDECGCKDDHDDYAGGSGGDVTQSNVAKALGVALNANLTYQSVDQTQGGGHDPKKGGYDPKGGYDEKEGYGSKEGGYAPKDDSHGCKCGGGVQAVGQSAWNKQDADASANAFQLWAANDNSPVRIGSPGSGGSVTQTNAALAFSLAANLNKLNQEAIQTQS